MGVLGLGRLILATADVEKTIAFYEKFGGTVARESGAVVIALSPNSHIELKRVDALDADHNVIGWDHLALITDDCLAACETVKLAGGTVEKWPSDNRMGDRPILNAVTYGLNGEKIEFIEFV